MYTFCAKKQDLKKVIITIHEKLHERNADCNKLRIIKYHSTEKRGTQDEHPFNRKIIVF